MYCAEENQLQGTGVGSGQRRQRLRKLRFRILVVYTQAPLQVSLPTTSIVKLRSSNCDAFAECAARSSATTARVKSGQSPSWCAPANLNAMVFVGNSFACVQEYLKPVRVCIKCKKLCWKAEAIVAAINANDLAAMQVMHDGCKFWRDFLASFFSLLLNITIACKRFRLFEAFHCF